MRGRGWSRLGLAGLTLVCCLGGGSERSWALPQVELGLQAGYRQDEVDWNIAGTVDVLSELKWERLDIYQLQFTAELLGEPIFGGARLAGHALAGAGTIVSGANQDSDYAGNQRTLEFSRSNNSADDGQVYDFSLGAGFRFEPISGLWLTPLIGYSRHEQQLVLQDGMQTLSRPDLVAAAPFLPPALGGITGLDSSYDIRWSGSWLGCDLLYQGAPQWQLSASAAFHAGEMKAKADWNLRPDFAHPVSFRQGADAYGVVLGLGGRYELGPRLALLLSGSYSDWSTDPGFDRIYFSDGSIATTRLNEVNWTSLALQAGVQYRFP